MTAPQPEGPPPRPVGLHAMRRYSLRPSRHRPPLFPTSPSHILAAAGAGRVGGVQVPLHAGIQVSLPGAFRAGKKLGLLGLARHGC
jgi:hypothetical protein